MLSVLVFLVALFALASAALWIELRKTLRSLHRANESKDSTAKRLFNKIELMSEELNKSYKRINELERGIEDGFGVSVRQEITNVMADFTKFEMVIMLAAVTCLLNRAKTIEDSKIYIGLVEKIQSLIDKMKESSDSLEEGAA